MGLELTHLLGNLGRADRHQMLSREEALRLIPALRSKDLRAAAIYYDSETDDARLTLEMVLAAAERGAAVANYAEVRALRPARPGNRLRSSLPKSRTASPAVVMRWRRDSG